jgi:hypothetical protein
MDVTGYRIREALRRQQLRRDTAAGQFHSSLHAFPDQTEPKATPDQVVARIQQAETSIARLQVAQTRYNLAVRVDVAGEGRLSLLECIKRIGGLGRVEKRWREAATVKEDRYGYGSNLTRDKDQVVAVRQISLEDASARTEAVDRKLATLREAIAVGNAQQIGIEDLDAALFE